MQKLNVEISKQGVEYLVTILGDNANLLADWPPFIQWLTEFDHERIFLSKVVIQSLDIVGRTPNQKIIFAKFKTLAFRRGPQTEIPGIIFMRPDAVCVLILVICEQTQERFILLTQQARIPAGSADLIELVAGTMDKKDGLAGRAVAEIEEETGLIIEPWELHCLGDWYPSPGATAEKIFSYYAIKKVNQEQMKAIKGQTHGAREENEEIRVLFVSIEEFVRQIQTGLNKDGKTLATLALLIAKHRQSYLGDMLKTIT